MLNEKIKYYRKKNMLTQEDLAEKLEVSRQIITKWESGMVMPNLEYLIDLSNLFGVTIDSLVKEDDCKDIDDDQVDLDQLNYFLVQAKKETYASKKGKIDSSRLASHDYMYEQGNLKYIDSFVGSSHFSGQELVYESNNPIWSMNYYGRVIGQHFDGDFLKEALRHVQVEKPYRGIENYCKGEYCYCCKVEGNIDFFHGYEVIFYQSKKIYECYFNGGMIK